MDQSFSTHGLANVIAVSFHFIKKVQTNAHDEHALVIRILINERSAGLMTCLNLIRENSCITHMAFSEVNNFIRL